MDIHTVTQPAVLTIPIASGIKKIEVVCVWEGGQAEGTGGVMGKLVLPTWSCWFEVLPVSHRRSYLYVQYGNGHTTFWSLGSL